MWLSDVVGEVWLCGGQSVGVLGVVGLVQWSTQGSGWIVAMWW